MRFLSHSQIMFLSVGILLFGPCISAQDVNLRTFDYSKADSIAIHFPKDKFKTYKDFVKTLTVQLNTDQEKFRAIYRWIAENISYSYSNMSIGADKAVTKKKAVCAGYSNLLMEMCNSVGLGCNMISGWAKNDQSCLGDKEPNHAWNEVKLNGKWYLTDVTWGSGVYDKKKRKYYKQFDTAYFLPTPEFFAMQHYPMDQTKTMLANKVNKSKFLNSYIWYEGSAKYGVKPLNERKATFSHKFNKEVTLKFQLDKQEHGNIFYNFDIIMDGDGLMDNESEITKDKKDGKYYATVTFGGTKGCRGIHCIDICYGGAPVCGYLINFH